MANTFNADIESIQRIMVSARHAFVCCPLLCAHAVAACCIVVCFRFHLLFEYFCVI
jgi:hypothetical protein